MQRYKNYCLMKLEFRILSEAMRSIGGADESILRRYVAGEMTLWDVADERHVSYETAKGRIRDLKKKLKAQAIAFFTEEAQETMIS
ncbi:MAG: hypothetical protein IJU80_05560 [Lachnospiraceae bacterium]|nr:hypothetical protein [Lachnospiraceae bacterium]